MHDLLYLLFINFPVFQRKFILLSLAPKAIPVIRHHHNRWVKLYRHLTNITDTIKLCVNLHGFIIADFTIADLISLVICILEHTVNIS